MRFYGTMRVNARGHLEIGGVDSVDLAKRFGTPLYVYDVELIRNRAKSFLKAFRTMGVEGQVSYASKAFSSIAILQLVHQEGLGIDVVSGGELYTAMKAGFPPEKIHFHGNNKSPEEIRMALDYQIGCFVVDNFYELELLHRLCEERSRKVNIQIRISPGIEAHTHHYIITGQEDSKFGFDLGSGQAEEALKRALSLPLYNVQGFHFHIGSQIFDTKAYRLAVKKIYQHLALWKEKYAYEPAVLNLGGGFGIRYTRDDHPLPVEKYVEAIVGEVKKEVEERGLSFPKIWLEPGRSIVGDAGVTLYSVGSMKEVPNIRRYVAVDGGMSDNIRPALYEAKYEAVVANRVLEPRDRVVSIAGKCCESGDMLIWDLPVPDLQSGDILAVFSTGAYGYSMASNYNRLPRPAVVFVENGEARLVVKRETYEDLVKNDLPLTAYTNI